MSFCGLELGQDQYRPQQIRQVVAHPVPDMQHAGRGERRPVDAALPDMASERTGILTGTGKLHTVKLLAGADSSRQRPLISLSVPTATVSRREQRSYRVVRNPLTRVPAGTASISASEWAWRERLPERGGLMLYIQFGERDGGGRAPV